MHELKYIVGKLYSKITKFDMYVFLLSFVCCLKEHKLEHIGITYYVIVDSFNLKLNNVSKKINKT